jgi:hypothetical protein
MNADPHMVVGRIGHEPDFGRLAESNWHLAERLRLEDQYNRLANIIQQLQEPVAFLREYNEWRRGDESLDMPCPRAIGVAIDTVCDGIEATTEVSK